MYKFKKISIRNMGVISNEVFAENCIHTIKQLKKEKEKNWTSKIFLTQFMKKLRANLKILIP